MFDLGDVLYLVEDELFVERLLDDGLDLFHQIELFLFQGDLVDRQ